MDIDDIRRQIEEAVRDAKASMPLAGSITNYVTADFVANAQLAAGGSAAMVYLPDEGEALARVSGAFYINVGTLLPSHEEAMLVAADTLHALETPWVLDPVGIGMGASRARILAHMGERKPSIVRCNASEAIALASAWGLETDGAVATVKGVDSADSVADARTAAVSLARYTGGAVSVSGEVDLVTDGHLLALSEGGSSLMSRVTGFGCSLGGVAAVYAACTDPFTAALAATNAYNLAASRAAARCDAPASFKVAFLDELFRATPAEIATNHFTIKEV